MKKTYFLSTCDTCKRILKEVQLDDTFELQDIKNQPLSEKQLEELYLSSGNYESLINKRARLYTSRDLKNKNLKESDYKELLLEHYTFLKRPVFILDKKIFIGNSKKTIESVIETLQN